MPSLLDSLTWGQLNSDYPATMALKRLRVEADLLLAIDIRKGLATGGDCTVADIKQAMTQPGIPTRLKRNR